MWMRTHSGRLAPRHFSPVKSPCPSSSCSGALRGDRTLGTRGKRERCPSGSPATSAARAWRDRLQARAARDFAPSNGTRQKHSCTDTCRRRDSPPQIALSGGDRDTGDGAQLGVSSAHARALVAPPSLCIFHTAFIRRPVDRRTAMQSPCALRLGCMLNFCSKTFCIDPLDTRVLWPAPGTREPQESQFHFQVSRVAVGCRCRESGKADLKSP